MPHGHERDQRVLRVDEMTKELAQKNAMVLQPQRSRHDRILKSPATSPIRCEQVSPTRQRAIQLRSLDRSYGDDVLP